MYKCDKCNYETLNISELANHYQYSHKENKKVICEKCGKEFKNKKGLKCHTKNSCEKIIKKKNTNHICPKCNLHIQCHILEHIDCCDGNGTKLRKIIKKEKISYKGLSFDERFGFVKSNEIKNKMSNKLKGKSGFGLTIESENNRRKKLSEIAKKNGYGGYIRGSGRGKKGWYEEYWCDSSWELAWVIYNLEHNIQFQRNTEKFEYYWKNKNHYWIPDFISDGIYYEIKGFWTEQNESKFLCFKEPLKILYEKDIKFIIDYVISKYGKDYIKLYNNYEEKNCNICKGHIWRYNKSGICIKCSRKID